MTTHLSANTALNEFMIMNNSNLISIDLRNGNNTNTWFYAWNNSNLRCISVDDPIYSTSNWTGSGFEIDSWTSYSADCNTNGS